MRSEPIGVGDIAHVIKRGARGMEIVRDLADSKKFETALCLLNDTYQDPNWLQAIRGLPHLARPTYWPERESLVHILAWTLVPNHFHLLVQEIREGGTALFMQRLCGSMTLAHNAKYGESGSLFQGPYKSKVVGQDRYLRYLAFYIQVKNVLEQRPGGLRHALKEFDAAWEWAIEFPHSSLGAYMTGSGSPIVENTLLVELFPDVQEFKKEAREMLLLHIERHESEYGAFTLEPYE